MGYSLGPGTSLNIKAIFPGIGIPTIKMRLSVGGPYTRLLLYIEMATCFDTPIHVFMHGSLERHVDELVSQLRRTTYTCKTVKIILWWLIKACTVVLYLLGIWIKSAKSACYLLLGSLCHILWELLYIFDTSGFISWTFIIITFLYII